MYAERRQKLIKKIAGGIAIFCAPKESIRNDDVHHDFRQDSDLYYLSGFEEPDCVLVLDARGHEQPKSIMFLRSRNVEREIWDGVRLGVEAAPKTLGVDVAYPIESLQQKLHELMMGADHVYYDLARNDREQNDQMVIDAVTRAKRSRRRDNDVPTGMSDVSPMLHEMRLIKDASELETMRRAAALTSLGHKKAMAVTVPGAREYQIEAAMEFEWRVRGSARNAYPSIVGSGPNACVLHYRAGTRELEANELVLVDAGCEKEYYASDVTRTWPVSGRFTDEQRDIYELVLKAEKACIAACVVGGNIDAVHDIAVRTLVEGLIALNLLEGPVQEAIANESYRRFYMHRTSHWIGMDVHDVGEYQRDGSPRSFEPGMVLTVEPGIYISPADLDVPEGYRGIGIRIEDDIVITAGDPENLTAAIPKEIDEIEALVGSQPLSL
ncbi:MAG: aminopeptidase P N-terminal domain-containing protein [Myxococcota bacterium]|nr:aminopeptidase P N-terminal domain-containing protein [Myxococcota bacterium]